jgi:hypothetical protein
LAVPLDGTDAGRQRQVADEQLLGELRRAGEHLAVGADDHAAPVEDQLVLPPDRVAEREGGGPRTGALGDHLLAGVPLPPGEWGGGGVDDESGAGGRLLALRRAGNPDVLADRQAHRGPVHLYQGRLAARLEVAALVEYAVVGQMHLAVDATHPAIREHRQRVVGGSGAGVDHRVGPVLPGFSPRLGEADEGNDPLDAPGHLVECLSHGGHEVPAQDQVLGRVPR